MVRADRICSEHVQRSSSCMALNNSSPDGTRARRRSGGGLRPLCASPEEDRHATRAKPPPDRHRTAAQKAVVHVTRGRTPAVDLRRNVRWARQRYPPFARCSSPGRNRHGTRSRNTIIRTSRCGSSHLSGGNPSRIVQTSTPKTVYAGIEMNRISGSPAGVGCSAGHCRKSLATRLPVPRPCSPGFHILEGASRSCA